MLFWSEISGVHYVFDTTFSRDFSLLERYVHASIFCKMKTNVRICNTLVFCMNSNTRPIIPLLVRIFQSPTVGVLLQTGFFRLTSSVIKRFMYWLVWIKYSPLFLFLLLCYWYTYCEFGAGKSEILFLESSLTTAQAWKILVTNATLLQAWFWLVSKQQK